MLGLRVGFDDPQPTLKLLYHRVGGSACGGGGSLWLFDEFTGGAGGCDR